MDNTADKTLDPNIIKEAIKYTAVLQGINNIRVSRCTAKDVERCTAKAESKRNK